MTATTVKTAAGKSLRARIAEFIYLDDPVDPVAEIRKQLQLAIEVEFATIPAYLCGLWSIKESGRPKKDMKGKDRKTEAYELIESVVLEEMLHMGLACNMLTALGGKPVIKPPVYPKSLPGGVEAGLTVRLQGLTKEYVQKTYMVIESPEVPALPPLTTGTPVTIGAFYDKLLRMMRRYSPVPKVDNQLNDSGLGLYEIQDFADIERAIAEIKAQGEGTANLPGISDEPDELAHYYKFAQIVAGGELIKKGTGRWEYSQELPVPFPEVWPMAEVPEGGYAKQPATYEVTAETRTKLAAFNTAYQQTVQLLEEAWTPGKGGQAKLSEAVKAMLHLEGLAAPLYATENPKDKTQHFGPEFLGA
ncbi:ferritin-like protein [Kitasatospora sp. NPDC004799]|uniref:ferritin-like domain-containing protein n=1 Tax=Kitasatospora sp. NPDC004799 TaxID=3154460 RepID=UPI0033AD1EBD